MLVNSSVVLMYLYFLFQHCADGIVPYSTQPSLLAWNRRPHEPQSSPPVKRPTGNNVYDTESHDFLSLCVFVAG